MRDPDEYLLAVRLHLEHHADVLGLGLEGDSKQVKGVMWIA
jgi:hypothetical protein